MKKVKQYFAILLVGLLLLTTACQTKSRTESSGSDTSDTSEVAGNPESNLTSEAVDNNSTTSEENSNSTENGSQPVESASSNGNTNQPINSGSPGKGSNISGRVSNLKGRTVRYQISPNLDKSSKDYKLMVSNIESIQKKLNCKIELVPLHGESGNNKSITTSVLAGKPIVDIWVQNGTSEFMPHYQAGLMQNLTDMNVFDFENVDWDASMEAMTFNKKAYGIRRNDPGNSTWQSIVLLFNNKLVNDYIPQYADKLYQWQNSGEWTWDKFEEVCKAFNTAVGSKSPLKACFDHSGAIYSAMLATRSVDWVKRDKNGKMTFNGSNNNAQAAMNHFKNYVDSDVLLFDNAANVNLGWSANMAGTGDKVGSFIDGQCLFAFNSVEGYYWNVFQFAETSKQVRDNVGIMMVPKMKKTDAYTHLLPLTFSSLSIPFGVSKPAEVATVLNYLVVEPLVDQTAAERRSMFFTEQIEPTLNSKTSKITEQTVMNTYDAFAKGKGFVQYSTLAINAETNIWGDSNSGWIGKYLMDISEGKIAQSAAIAAVTNKYNKALNSLSTGR